MAIYRRWSGYRSGDANDVKLGAFCVSEPDAGSTCRTYAHERIYDEANDEQVLNGTVHGSPTASPMCTSSLLQSTPSWGTWPSIVCDSSEHKGLSQGRST